MQKIFYITKNEEKIKNANLILKGYGIEVAQAAIETPEIQASSAKDVAMYSAEYGSIKIAKPVIKMDVEFMIEALRGFPGPYIKHINKYLTPDKILALMKGETNRRAAFNDIICYCDASKNVSKVFQFKTAGIIGDEPRGQEGWGMDQIFIPDRFTKTLAEMTKDERLGVWKNNLWKDLAEYLKQLN